MWRSQLTFGFERDGGRGDQANREKYMSPAIRFFEIFDMDKLTPEQRHKNMVAVKAKGTKIEILFAKALWAAGIRYRKNDKTVFGHPDFSHKGKKIAIFCDGEMWHGKDWEKQQLEFKSNREFWIPKIERNIQRDNEVNEYLTAHGWTVLRFWETDIKKNIDICVAKVKKEYVK